MKSIFINLAMLIGGLALGALFVSWRTSSQKIPDVVQARSFEVVDQLGKVRVSIAADKDRTLILMHPVSGKNLISLRADEDSSTVLVSDGKHGVACLNWFKDGGIRSFVGDNNDKGYMAAMSEIQNNKPTFSLDDSKFKKIITTKENP